MSSPMFKGKRVFLSGPMTGYPDFNRGEFRATRRELESAGAEFVYDPSKADALSCGDEWPHEAYMALTIHALSSYTIGKFNVVRPYYDYLVLLDGWEDSAGALAEKAVAEALGIPVVEMATLIAPPYRSDGFDRERYRAVVGMLEDALQTMTEWGCGNDA